MSTNPNGTENLVIDLGKTDETGDLTWRGSEEINISEDAICTGNFQFRAYENQNDPGATVVGHIRVVNAPCGPVVPEFPTVVVPLAAMLGLIFAVMHIKRKK